MSAQRNSSTRSAPQGHPSRRQAGGLEISKRAMPIANSFHVLPRPPKTFSAGRNTVIDGSELFGDVESRTVPAFGVRQFRFNPGLVVFERLSKIASAFEKYTIRKLQIVYVPTRAVVTSPGSVHLAADFDPDDAPPSSLAALSTYEVQATSRVFDKCTLDIPPNRMHDGVRAKKLRCGPVAGDLALYDACSIIVAVFGGDDAPTLGQLWVHYEIVLISPQVEPSRPVPQNYTLARIPMTTTQNSGTPTTMEFGFWSDPADVNATVNGLGLELDTTDLGLIHMPCGTFSLQARINYTTGSTLTGSALMELLVNGAVTQSSFGSFSSPAAVSTRTDLTLEAFLRTEPDDSIKIRVTLIGGTVLNVNREGTSLSVTTV